MSRLKEILTLMLLVLSTLVIGIIVLPFAIILAPFGWLQDRQFNREYQQYLKTIEGKNFFCYNNRKKGFDYIQTQILPRLPKEVEPLFLNGKSIESNYESRFISKAFYSFQHYSRFPQLLKIRNGKAVDCSLNAELFNCLNHGKDQELIFNKIEVFFELDNK
ncbi:hypothetical protein QQ020_35010 [Fulvivirgaceae bacterium BMA12]|uniref:Uncharacterized protein n=1 Tax=Agaribacillus aureus TaxID=3051825 RepID=A0ABT8LK87_9BACT|nr:hypothetical protein [Fulvivirgaceae bacterium BMA12]